MLLGSAMCWFVCEIRKLVIVSWLIWVVGFFTLPALFGSAWAFLVLQTILALVLVNTWKLDDI